MKKLKQAVQGWCCLTGTLIVQGEPQCMEQGGDYFDTQEQAQQSCVQKMKVMKPGAG